MLTLLEQVLTAARIHNRHLRTQFAQHSQSSTDYEYLFLCGESGVSPCMRFDGSQCTCQRQVPCFSEPRLDCFLTCCALSAAVDMLFIAQHGFGPAYNGWEDSNVLRLTSFLNLAAANSSADAGSSGVMQTLVCKACLGGPCKAITDDDAKWVPAGESPSVWNDNHLHRRSAT